LGRGHAVTDRGIRPGLRQKRPIRGADAGDRVPHAHQLLGDLDHGPDPRKQLLDRLTGRIRNHQDHALAQRDRQVRQHAEHGRMREERADVGDRRARHDRDHGAAGDVADLGRDLLELRGLVPEDQHVGALGRLAVGHDLAAELGDQCTRPARAVVGREDRVTPAARQGASHVSRSD
jgi:hypothetical protein